MEPEEIKRLREQWADQLEDLLLQRQQIDEQIVGLQTMLKGLNHFDKEIPSKYRIEPPPLPPGFEDFQSLGLTDAIRQLLSEYILAMTPRQVRDRLVMLQYELPKDNPMAAIHGVLRRLVGAGEIKPIENEEGKTAYVWVTPIQRALTQGGSGIIDRNVIRRGLETLLPPRKK
jgi:hypothetical protein